VGLIIMSNFLAHRVRRTRQNHAVEHATISLLMHYQRNLQLVAGRSNHRGFYVFGHVDTAALTSATTEALSRLQRGDAYLALHPNCGTNLVTTGTLAGVAAFLTTATSRRRRASWLDQLPLAIMATIAAMIVGRPLGMQLQRHVTTLADVRDLRVGAISRRQGMAGRWVQHFVHLEEAS
jgi:hypothetical protein